jgi:hypothetical protein
MSQWDGRALYALERLGVTPDPAIVWNAIPLSFILDWVYPVGEWLHERRYTMIDMNIVIDGCGFGAASTLRQTILIRATPTADWQTVTTRQWFIRERISFDVDQVKMKSLQFQGCTLRKVLSGTSLLFQAYIAKGRKR